MKKGKVIEDMARNRKNLSNARILYGNLIDTIKVKDGSTSENKGVLEGLERFKNDESDSL